MSAKTQTWEVTCDVDGESLTEQITVPPGPFQQGTAEFTAINEHRAKGAKEVRCTYSRFLRVEPSLAFPEGSS